MKTYKEIMDEAKQTKLLNSYGYKGPFKGVDGHVSFIWGDGQEILLDLPGNEWHLMLDGVVTSVGKLDNDSLTNFLTGKPYVSEDTELEKAKIYEPDGGTYSVTDKS